MNLDLNRNTSIETSLGHLIFTWNFISEKLAGEPLNKIFSEEEKRSIWYLEDILEKELLKQGVSSMSDVDWNSLVQSSSEHVKSLKIECLD